MEDESVLESRDGKPPPPPTPPRNGALSEILSGFKLL